MGLIMKLGTYDPECWHLAVHFLEDRKAALEATQSYRPWVEELSLEIQMAIENWLADQDRHDVEAV
jgi:hypothetical protein